MLFARVKRKANLNRRKATPQVVNKNRRGRVSIAVGVNYNEGLNSSLKRGKSHPASLLNIEEVCRHILVRFARLINKTEQVTILDTKAFEILADVVHVRTVKVICAIRFNQVIYF